MTALDDWATDRDVLLTPSELASLLADTSAICDAADAQGLRPLLHAGRRVELGKSQPHDVTGEGSSPDASRTIGHDGVALGTPHCPVCHLVGVADTRLRLVLPEVDVTPRAAAPADVPAAFGAMPRELGFAGIHRAAILAKRVIVGQCVSALWCWGYR